MIYKAILGNKYIINDFIDKVELRLDHEMVLPANIYKYDRNTVVIDTPLLFRVGQPVSIGGYKNGGKGFRMLELSITDYPVFDDAYITEILYDNNDDMVLKPEISSILDGTFTEPIPRPIYELMVIEQPEINEGEQQL